MDFNEFLAWEQATRDTIDFKKVYVDMADDLNAGLILSEIVYWYLPSKNGGENKLRVLKEGTYWIASRRYDWWERTRVTLKQFDRALNILIDRGLIEKRIFKFKGEPTQHLRLLEEKFLKSLDYILKNPPVNPFLPKRENENLSEGENELSPMDETLSLNEQTPYTESLTENTPSTNQQNKHISKVPAISSSLMAETRIETILSQKATSQDTDIEKAIARAWNIQARGMIQQIKKTLLGQYPIDTEYAASNVTPAATPNEIDELGRYYRWRNPKAVMPLQPFKIQRWIEEVRNLQETCHLVYREKDQAGYVFELVVKYPPELMDKGYLCTQVDPRLAFLRHCYPAKYQYIQTMFDYIDRELPEPEETMAIRPTFHNDDYEFQSPVMIPFNVLSQANQFDAVMNYFHAHHPELEAEFRRQSRENGS